MKLKIFLQNTLDLFRILFLEFQLFLKKLKFRETIIQVKRRSKECKHASLLVAAPLFHMNLTGNHGNMLIYQQQLIQTQKICVEQRMMNFIAASVEI